MTFFRQLSLIPMLAAAVMAETPAGWKILHDRNNACQMAVPGDWTVSPESGWLAQAPKDQGDVSLVSQPGRTVKPMNEMAQKALMVNKMIDNSAERVFWSSQPTKSDHPITPYHASVPGKGGICAAVISARAGVPEDLVKKIVATMAPQ